MAAMSTEQFADLLKAMKEMVSNGEGGGGKEAAAPPGLGSRNESGGRLVGKHMRSDVFSGEATKFDEWSFSFKRGIRSQNCSVFMKMNESEQRKDDVHEVTELPKELESRSAELYDILCQYCNGEALMIVRSVADMEGFAAWQRLYKKYNPRIMARGLRLLTEVVNPTAAKDLAEVENAIVRWEEKVKMLQNQFEENVSPFIKIAILTNMLPSTLQDYIYTHADKETGYDELKEKIRAMTSNKLASMKQVPMDVGQVGEETWHDGSYGEMSIEDEQQIDAVSGHLQCRNCQGYGHFARECPSHGKGDKGKGKGKSFANSKGGHYTNFKGNKGGGGKGGGAKGGKSGKGKGFAGTCYTCGQVGHRAAECTTATPTNAVEAEEAAEIGGIWIIGAVNAEISHSTPTSSYETNPPAGSVPRGGGVGQRDERLHHAVHDLPGHLARLRPGHQKGSLKENKTAAPGTGIQNIDRHDSNSCKHIPEKNTKDALDIRGRDFRMSNVSSFEPRTKRTMVEFGGIQKDNWVLKNRFMHLANDDIDDDHIDAGSQVVVVGSTVEKNPYYQEINMVGQKVGAVGSKVEKNPYYQEINETKEEFIDVCPVEVDKGDGAPHQRTRTSCMMFNVAQVSKPLAAAGKVVDAGNRVVLDQRGSYVEHVATGERMHLRKEKGVYVLDVEFEDGDRSTITLDSGAGVNVWPRGLKTNIPMEAKNESLKMFAANGTPIEHDGTKRVRFKGIQAPFHGQSR
jgi:hypothetical protein